MPRKAALVVRFLLAILILTLVPIVSAQGPVERVEILAIDGTTRFPVVELRFRAADADGRHVPGIQRAQIGIQDGETAAAAESPIEQEGPLSVYFVIETGVSLDDAGWTAAREAIRLFGASHMAAGNVSVAVSYVQGNELVPLEPATNDANTIANLGHEANPSNNALAGAMPALTGLLDDMQREKEASLGGESPIGAQAVVFLTRQLESGIGYETLVARSRDHGIPIYTALLRPGIRTTSSPIRGTPQPPPLDARVEQLALDTGGEFMAMGEDPARLTNVFANLAQRGRQYVVVYRVADDQPGTRNVTLTLPGAVGPVSASTSYQIAIEPPRVTFTTPENGAIIERQAQAAGGDLGQATPTEQPVVVTVSFGQNPERRVRRAALLVEGVEVDRIELPPRGDGEALTINLNWDMRSVAAPGDSNRTLVVEVEDELGLVERASAEVTVRINVPVAPPIDPTTGEPVVTPVPVDEDPPYEAEECFLDEPFCSRVELPIRNNPVAAISLLVALLSLILVALMWINRGKAPVQRMTQTVRRGFDRLTNRYRRSEVRAYLELMAGDGDVGHRYEIYGDTPIGRSRQNAELLFQQEAETSPISRLHCTITDEEDHFMLRDEDSANGTFLNGERLTPVVPYRLSDGDIIELARVERGGVRLRFVAATTEDTLPPNANYTFVDARAGDGSAAPPPDQTRGRF